MRPTRRKNSGLVCLLSLVLSVPLLGQQSAAKPSSSGDSSSSKITAWLEKAPGVKVTTVPRPQDGQPEFAILQLKADAYKEFQKDPKEFLNKLKIFSKPIYKVSTCPRAASKTDPAPDETYYYVVITHWPTSDAAYQVYEGWSPQ
jgi:hypothetical protein